MKKIFHTLIFTVTIAASGFAFTSCDESNIKGDNESKIEGSEYHGQERSPEDTMSRKEIHERRDSVDDMNNTDPEGSGANMDKHEDNLNSGK
ncbi:MAG: hypothetical protein ACXWDO_05535 [Bacteroidia bacterium]